MVELYILGPAEIKDPKGNSKQSFLAGPKRLALLVYLLLNSPLGFHRRDSLLPLFWPDQGQKSARNSLSNMLYHIRQTVDTKAIVNRGTEEVKLRPETFWSDVNAFEHNLQNGLPKKALKLYRGDLLKGFHIPEVSPDLDQWLDMERNRFCKMAFNASLTLADRAEETEDYKAAQRWAKKAADLEPICDKTHGRLIQLLNRTGNKSEASQVYQSFVDRYRRELEAEPPKELTALAKEINSNESSNLLVPVNQPPLQGFPKSPPKKSIAVLPFKSLGMDENSFFTDASHADILVRLSKIPDLKLTSRTSVMAFRHTDKLLPEIAHDLGVRWILNGEVQETENTVRINVKLVNALEDRMVWAHSYQKEFTAANVFQTQAEITTHISEALTTQLARNENTVIEQSPTNDLEALCLHAQGRWSLDKRTKKGIKQAIVFFQQALALDPQYFHAWIGMADAKILLMKYGFCPSKTLIAEAENALSRALMVGPESAETFTTLALLHEVKREGPAAVQKYLQAIANRSDYAEAYNWLSWAYLLVGKSKKALQSAKCAVKLNPLSIEALGNLSLSWLSNGNYRKAYLESKRTQLYQPGWTTGLFLEGVTLFHQGQYWEASEKLQNLSVPWAKTGPLLTRALAFVSMNEDGKAIRIKKQLEERRDDFGVAMIHAAFGEVEECLRLFSNISAWDYWPVLSIHHLYPKILSPLFADKRFERIKQEALASFGVKN